MAHNMPNDGCETNKAAIQAVKDGNLAEVKRLLADGFKPNQPITEDNESMVHVAAKSGQKNVLALLVENGGDCTSTNRFGLETFYFRVYFQVIF